MGLLGRLAGRPPRLENCPICNDLHPADQLKMHGEHLRTHVHRIEHGEGAGGYTFRCSCGPANMYWEEDHQALAGLAIHLSDRHGHSII